MPLTLDPIYAGTGIGNVARRRLLGEPEDIHAGDIADLVPGLGQAKPINPNPGLNPDVPPPLTDTTAPVTLGGSGGGVGAGGVGVGTQALGAGVPRWATWAEANPQAPVADVAKAAMAGKGLKADPQLAPAPLGQFTDSTYEAANAVLAQQINAAYQDILQQTGYDVGGKHMPGEIEMKAGRVERDSLTGMTNAVNDVTGQMQQAGTVFSGYHALQRAQASQPYITTLGDLAVDTPKALAGNVEKASDLMREYAVQRNLLLQQAADREAARLAYEKAAAAGAAPPPPPTEPVVDPNAGYQISGGTGIGLPDYSYPDQSLATGKGNVTGWGYQPPVKKKPAPGPSWLPPSLR